MGFASRIASPHAAGVSRSTSSGSFQSGRRTTRTSSSSTPASSRASWRMSASKARRAQRARLLARRVDVVRERDRQLAAPVAARLAVADEQCDLAGRERGAQGRDHVLVARLVRHQCVGVALDDDRLAGLADGALRPIDEIQRPALVEQRRGARVQVLRAVAGRIGEDPPTQRTPIAWPLASRMGNRTRSRKKSYAPARELAPARWRGRARPTSISSPGPMSRRWPSFVTSWSQPAGAQPSWCLTIVSSLKPRSRRYASPRSPAFELMSTAW